MLKIVCDTNTLVSGLLFKGNEFRLLKLAFEGKVELYSSKPIFEELTRVLAYPRVSKHVADINASLTQAAGLLNFAAPTETVTAIRDDPSDNKILECALAANAGYVVSGDAHLLNLKKYRGIRIMRTRNMLSILSKQSQHEGHQKP